MLANASLCAKRTVRPNSTKTSEFGAEKGLLQVYCKETGGSYPQNPELPKGIQQSMFKGQVREGGHRVRDQLLHNSLIG